MKNRIHGTIGLPAKTPVGHGVTETDIIGVPAQPVGSKKVEIGKVTAGLHLLTHDIPVPELRVLAISDIEVGVQILPVDAGTVEALKEVFSIDGQVVPVPVRKHQDGRHELISGCADILALRELGRSDVLALVISGLTDLDAQFLEVASSIHPKLSVLNRALLHARLEPVIKERAASQHETALLTNRDLSVRKIAEHLGFKKDVVFRSRKMARIHPDVHRDIRELKFDNNQQALLDISDAGVTAAEQLAKLQELLERRSRAKQNRINPKKNVVAPLDAVIADREMPRDERANEMPDVPEFLRRNSAKVTYDQAKNEWSRCRDIVLALEPEDRQRFLNECVLPIVHTGPSAGAPGTAKMLPLSGGSDQ
jgi:hypothetical protein